MLCGARRKRLLCRRPQASHSHEMARGCLSASRIGELRSTTRALEAGRHSRRVRCAYSRKRGAIDTPGARIDTARRPPERRGAFSENWPQPGE